MKCSTIYCLPFAFAVLLACSNKQLAYKPLASSPEVPDGYQLLWNDEFDKNGKPDSISWSYERGLVRNNELQWYQEENANVVDGVLVIEGKRERVENSIYEKESKDWRRNTPFAEYTSASINTNRKRTFRYGLVEVRARIDTSIGIWPAIWTLGETKGWPANGEIDIMEYYRINDTASILANAAWADARRRAVWDGASLPLTHFLKKDPEWPQKFHVWKMDWTHDYIRLYLDDELLNEVDLSKTLNSDGFNPFHQPHYILLNLAIGSNGGDPSDTTFPRKYEVDYVRVYQKK